ncbi:MAG TPA: glycosyltransferase family A protein, partial [Blastocatellia bacterium]|nr:glycosyltransferase family A protein [Blastocatellia bacterium]
MSSIDPLANQTGPLVSVIVPCYNSDRTIKPCLAAIINQQTSVSFDVTVVDSSSDHTPRIVEQEFPSVRLIHLESRTYAGAARNVGLRATRAPFCLMIDSDCVARPDLIERMIVHHRADHYAAVGGSLANGTPLSLSGLVGYLAEFKEFMPDT